MQSPINKPQSAGATGAEITNNQATSRRNMLGKAGILAGAVLLAGRGGNVPGIKVAHAQDTTPAPAGDPGDIEILNFALTLEYLEAEFYNRVVEADTRSPFLRGRPKDFARILQRDENTHVQAVSDLITKLGGTPVAKPEFRFPPEAFISQIAWLQLSSTLEATGVSAYLGQAPRVKSEEVLKSAASIYGNEARHTGMIRFLLGDVFAPSNAENPETMEEIMQRVKPFIVS